MRFVPQRILRPWYLGNNFEWKPKTGSPVTVLKGFVTDFASIPRLFWIIFPRWAKYGPASVVHDFLYWEQKYSRWQADRMMLEAMQDSEVFPPIRFFIYAALRTGGFFSWRNNKRKKANGYKNIIIQFPEDPNLEWDEFRTKFPEMVT